MDSDQAQEKISKSSLFQEARGCKELIRHVYAILFRLTMTLMIAKLIVRGQSEKKYRANENEH